MIEATAHTAVIAGAERLRRALRRSDAAASFVSAELEHLADLHRAGELTDREFVAAKARVLGL